MGVGIALFYGVPQVVGLYRNLRSVCRFGTFFLGAVHYLFDLVGTDRLGQDAEDPQALLGGEVSGGL